MTCMRDNEYLRVILILAWAAFPGCSPADREPARDRSSVETPPVETPPAETPSAETPSAETPSAETPPVETPPPDAETTELTIHFSRGESVVAVSREAPTGSGDLEGAVRQLLQGPTPTEREAGLHSWFSDTTAHALRSVTVDDAGRAVVDFEDLRALIPNASTSAGSGMLLRELNATVFAVPSVRSVEYRIEGSCEQFWEWLQYGGCRVQERS